MNHVKVALITNDINSAEFIKLTNLLHDCGFQFTTNFAEAEWIFICPDSNNINRKIINIGGNKIENYTNFKNFTYNNFPCEILS